MISGAIIVYLFGLNFFTRLSASGLELYRPNLPAHTKHRLVGGFNGFQAVRNDDARNVHELQRMNEFLLACAVQVTGRFVQY